MELYEQFDSNTMIKIIILLDGTIHTKHKWQLFTVHYMLKKKRNCNSYKNRNGQLILIMANGATKFFLN